MHDMVVPKFIALTLIRRHDNVCCEAVFCKSSLLRPLPMNLFFRITVADCDFPNKKAAAGYAAVSAEIAACEPIYMIAGRL